MFKMADSEHGELQDFLGKIDTIHDLINDIKASDGSDGVTALQKADE